MDTLTDLQFITQFEDLSLDPGYFNHLGHLRLAWLYLLKHDLTTAIDKVCCGIKAYAESLGTADKFHYTLTDAIVRIEHQRMMLLQQQLNVGSLNAGQWSDFIAANADLVNDGQKVLQQYYSPQLLATEQARLGRVEADIKSL